MRVADELDETSAADPLQVSAMVQQRVRRVGRGLPSRPAAAFRSARAGNRRGGRLLGDDAAFHSPEVPVPQVHQGVRGSDTATGGPGGAVVGRRHPGVLPAGPGCEQWPLHAEVDLYETMPGTMLGQLTQDETLPSESTRPPTSTSR